MTETLNVDELRDEIRDKYSAVVQTPTAEFHFHTGRQLTERLGYDQGPVDTLPEVAVESFAGVANPFEHRAIQPGEKVVDLGSGAGLDSFLAAVATGPTGEVVGIDMTTEMVEKSIATAGHIGCDNVDFREGYLEELPIADEWADVVISNGVINLCPDKQQVFAEAFRVLRPGGVLQFADIANSKPVPEEAKREIDLWTGWIAGGLPCAGWTALMEAAGFVDVTIGDGVDTFAGAHGEGNARAFGVYGHSFMARKP